MSILFYLYQFPAYGGIETVTATLANAFVERGMAVCVLSHNAKNNDCESLRLAKAVETFEMPDAVRECSRGNREYIERLIRERNIDIVIFQDSYANIEANLENVWNRVPVVVCEHNAPYVKISRAKAPISPRELLGRLKWPLTAYWLRHRECARRRFLYAHCARYVLLSNRFYGEFRAVTGLVDTRKLRAIPNPISGMFLSGSQSPKEKIILFSATLTSRKGPDLLLDAWSKIANDIQDWRLVFAGDGDDKRRLEDMVRVRKIPRVEFLGYQADMRPWYQRAAILAFPSRREGWGLVLHEAMTYGCVPVAFESYSAIFDIIFSGQNGLLAPAFDVDAFAKAIVELVRDKEAWDVMSKAALSSVRSYSAQTIGLLWQKELKSLCDC